MCSGFFFEKLLRGLDLVRIFFYHFQTSKKNHPMANPKKVLALKSRKTPLTDYHYVTRNIYRSGPAYRVRVTVNGFQFSGCFDTERKAVRWRNRIKRELSA
jgi:hypothetical protein